MRNKVALQALCLIFPVFIKSMVSFPLYSNGLYQHWDAETNSFLYCREVLVKRGYEAIPCTENEAEDSVRKCPVGQYQPDQTNSSSSPHCIVEPECTEEEIKKDLKCDDGYCWTVCICSLEVGKCGLDPLNCLDIKNIKCMGKVLQDCSCALPVVPPKLPTSPPTRSILSTTLKPINPDWTAKTLSPIPTDTAKNNDKTDVTKDGTDTGSKGNEVVYLIPVIIISVLVIPVVLCIKRVHKHCSNRPIEVTSLQAKKVAVVSPFNEVQTVPVEDSPAAMNTENQPLRGEGYSSHSEGVTAVNLSMDWITLGSSIYHDNTNQQDD